MDWLTASGTRDRIANGWQVLRGSLWFLPALFTSLAILLAYLLLQLDRLYPIDSPAFLFTGGPAGAREILATVATAVITVAGVSFSITIVALSLAASQYGPLLLASYLRDTINQAALGLFLGTFIYCLIVLSQVSESGFNRPLPALSVAFSLALALASLAMFVAFIHHLAQSIRSDRLTARVGDSLLEAISEMYPAPLDDADAEQRDPPAPPLEGEVWAVPASGSGYLQAVEWNHLLAVAKQHGLVLRVAVRPGDFIARGGTVAHVHGGATARDRVRRQVVDAFLIGRVRTPTQDPEYAVHQLAQVAVRALSPGINDPYTALTCIDWLEAALCLLAARQMPSGVRHADDGVLRLIAPQAGFELVANAAFNKIRHAGRADASILMRLAHAARSVASHARRSSDREVLGRHLAQLRAEGLAGLATEKERTELNELCAEALEEIRR